MGKPTAPICTPCGHVGVHAPGCPHDPLATPLDEQIIRDAVAYLREQPSIPEDKLLLINIPCEPAPLEVYERIVDDLMQQDEPTRLFLWVLYKRLNEKFGFTVAESPRMIRELSRGHTSVT